MKKTSVKEEKDKIENDIIEDLINELKNFDIKNFKFKNGEFKNDYIRYIIHDNKYELFRGKKKDKDEEGDFYYDYYYKGYYKFIPHGNIKDYFEKIESEYFYNRKIGRGKMMDDNKEKIFFEFFNFHYNEDYLKDKIIIEQNNNGRNKNLGRVLVKDLNKEIIYEITVKLNYETDKYGENIIPEGIGLVKDNRNGEILIVNFNNNNILSKNFQDLSIFIDKEEFEMNKKNKNKEEEQSTNQKAKKFINDIIYKTLENNNIDVFADKINEKIVKEKIKKLGIEDQGFSKECWVYSLSEIIYMANARKYKRKLENFNEIYNKIIKKYGKPGKTNDQMETIMKEILPSYGLNYEKVEDEEKLNDYIKRGIKCIATFDLNNKEWRNFSNYFNFKDENKLLTKEILEKPNNVENPNEIEGHSVILSDIDKDDNYIFVNSWGENWGNDGTFKTKKDCLNLTFYAVYYTIDLLTQEEKNNWEKLKIDIKNYFNEFKSIRCVKCGLSAEIEKFHIDENNNLKCPFLKCNSVFEIKDNFEFLLEQFMSYALDSKRNEIKDSIMNFD